MNLIRLCVKRYERCKKCILKVWHTHSLTDEACSHKVFPNGRPKNGLYIGLNIAYLNTYIKSNNQQNCTMCNLDNFVRDHSQTLVGGTDAKKGSSKFLSLVRGVLKKVPQIFQQKLCLHAFFWGWPVIFKVKRGPWNFLNQAPLTSACEQFLNTCHKNVWHKFCRKLVKKKINWKQQICKNCTNLGSQFAEIPSKSWKFSCQ